VASRADYDALTDDLEDRAAALAYQVGDEIGGLWSGAIIDAATRAVDAAVADDAGGALANVVGDSQQVRMQIMEPVNARVVEVHGRVASALSAAIIEGYTDALFGRAAIHNRDGGDVVEVEVTERDMDALASYPVFGHPARDWAARLIATTRWEFEALGMQPVIGQKPSAAIPARAVEVNNAFRTSVQDAVTQAYLSGTQAASEEWRQYLAGL